MSKSAIFVACAIVVTAICVAVIASFGFSLSFTEAILAAFASLAGLTVIHLAFVKAAPADDGRLDGRVDGLDRLVNQLESRLETVEARLIALDGAATARSRAATQPLMEEIAALGSLVTAVAREVASHDVEIGMLKTAFEAPPDYPQPEAPRPAAPPQADAAPARAESVQPAVPAQQAAPQVQVEPARVAPAQPVVFVQPAPAVRSAPEVRPEPPVQNAPAAEPSPVAAAPVAAVRPQEPAAPSAPPALAPSAPPRPAQPEPAPRPDLAARVAQALQDGRIETYLQPIVTLPSRRVAHYEALARMVEGETILAAADFLPAAMASGRIGEIDGLALQGAASIAGRLAAKGVGAVFVNVSFGTLADAGARSALATLFQTRRELAPLIAIELAQRDFLLLAGEARITLERLVLLGVRLSIDGVTNLAFDPRDLARRGVRFIKAPAKRLIDPDAAASFSVHPADLSGLLSRHGVDLIATHVEEDRVVPELLDLDIRFAQGRLFGAPRPIRPVAPGARPEGTATHPAPAETPTRLVPRAAAAR